MTNIIRVALLSASTGALALCATAAVANNTITDTSNSYTAGIGPNGELFDYGSYIGLKNPAGSDYISPGTPRDSWGIATNLGSAYADQSYYGTSNVSSSTTLGANTATVNSTTGAGVSVSHYFAFLTPNILSIQETVTNTSGGALTGVVFRRNVDFDVDPTAFYENTTGPLGANPDVLQSSYYGFENPDPSSGGFFFSCTFGCNATGDLGAGIDLSLGSFADGESKTFAFYYGINAPGQTLNGLFAQAVGEGLSYTIGTQSSENGQYPGLGAGSAILGVSNVGTIAHGVPEPASWALMLGGFGLIGGALRRRRVAVTFA